LNEAITFRRANLDDAKAIARLFRRSFSAALPFIPTLHTADEDFLFFSGVLERCEVWVAERDASIVGFCAFRTDWVDHLYVAPETARCGIGSKLISIAKDARDYLQLWTFQRNLGAMGFYQAMGFMPVTFTDGANNEEREPDVLFEWRRV
jgi:putative acetyltransferase